MNGGFRSFFLGTSSRQKPHPRLRERHRNNCSQLLTYSAESVRNVHFATLQATLIEQPHTASRKVRINKRFPHTTCQQWEDGITGKRVEQRMPCRTDCQWLVYSRLFSQAYLMPLCVGGEISVLFSAGQAPAWTPYPVLIAQFSERLSTNEDDSVNDDN